MARAQNSAWSRLTWSAAPLVFGSGLCALVYQMVWTRYLRLIFGASTAASSAVVAIFIAGLGFGGLWFGPRVEKSGQPLRVYARLELAIAGLSAITPLSLQLVRALYVWSGGSSSLGHAGSQVVRLVLAAVVLLPPTWLMGGTLPALARAIEVESDGGRRGVAFLYACNTLGAVVGAALCTFVWLEALGNRGSLYLACALNVAVGAVAYALARSQARSNAPVVSAASAAVGGVETHGATAAAAPAWFVYASAAVVGFAFFLMELVWYRVFGPLLGGSVFSFGLILCVALAGIGCGSALYAAFGSTGARSLGSFALSCAAEAVCIALPYALGDDLAVTALFLQPLGVMGFSGQAAGWVVIASCAVFPAAIVSGWQFPQLIALLGAGRTNVARDVGNAYAANTAGAIAGALAGGFGLLPALGALGAWRAVIALLAVFSLVALLMAVRVRWRAVSAQGAVVRFQFGAALALAALGLVLLRADGPSVAFRHAQIGVGRVPIQQFDGPNAITAFLTQERRAVDWQTDGIESAVAITHYDGLAFIVNGKSDGSALMDAPTQVMGGLLGAALLPQVKRALVIGLGTGSTAGWLASLPEIERVDVAEIEPAIAEVAARCALVNQNALDNPKLHVLRGDARELLSVLRADYDVIFSEPSNPYRAGVASMYTREFYAAVRERLPAHGLFVQWLQAYDVDASSVRTIYATLAASFPHVETWSGLKEDLLLVASQRALVHDVDALRARLSREPFVSALRLAWHTDMFEGFLAHFVASAAFTRVLAGGDVRLNTDDVSPVEFGFARSVRSAAAFSTGALLASAQARGHARPTLRGTPIDWGRVDYEREIFALIMGSGTSPNQLTPTYRNRFMVLSKWANGDFTGALALRHLLDTATGSLASNNAVERLALAELFAYEGSIESERYIEALLSDRPTEAKALHAVYLLRHARRKAGTEMLTEALARYRNDPWPHPLPFARVLNALTIEDEADRPLAARWLEALAQPFALRVNETARDRTRLRLAYALGASHPSCVRVFEDFEPYPPWTENMLQFRAACYDAHAHPLRDRAAADLAHFRRAAQPDLERLLAR